MASPKKVLVTGSQGFIGSNLVKRLKHLGYYVEEWTKDVRTINSLAEPNETVFHLAAITSQKRFQSEPYLCFDVNVQGTLAVLEYCKSVGSKCVYASTSGVYAVNKSIQVDEASETSPESNYAISKWLGEELCQLECSQGNVTSVILRLFNVYGPGQKQPFIIPYITDSLDSGKNITIETPNSVRDFVHVSDVVDSFIKSANSSTPGCQIYNIGSGIPTTILDLARLCEKISGRSGNISTNPQSITEQSGVYADTRKAQINLKWRHNKGLADGLQPLINGE